MIRDCDWWEESQRMARDSRSVPKWEMLGDTRQFSSRRTVRDAKFSYEWAATAGRQAKDLQDTKNERVRKRMKVKGEESGDGQVMNDDFAKEFK